MTNNNISHLYHRRVGPLGYWLYPSLPDRLYEHTTLYHHSSGRWRLEHGRGIIFLRRFGGQNHGTVNSILTYYTILAKDMAKSRSNFGNSQRICRKNDHQAPVLDKQTFACKITAKSRQNRENHGYQEPIANFTALAQKRQNSRHRDTVKKEFPWSMGSGDCPPAGSKVRAQARFRG